MRRAAAALLLLFVLLVPATSRAATGTACAGAEAAPNTATALTARAATLCLINEVRARHGRPAIRPRGLLRDTATRYAAEMVARRFFGHVSPDGRTLLERIRRSGYLTGARDYTLGEILAWGPDGSAAPATIVAKWMASPPHRAVILDGRLRHAGVGIVPGSPRQVAPGTVASTYAVNFGRRVSGARPPATGAVPPAGGGTGALLQPLVTTLRSAEAIAPG